MRRRRYCCRTNFNYNNSLPSTFTGAFTLNALRLSISISIQIISFRLHQQQQILITNTPRKLSAHPTQRTHTLSKPHPQRSSRDRRRAMHKAPQRSIVTCSCQRRLPRLPPRSITIAVVGMMERTMMGRGSMGSTTITTLDRAGIVGRPGIGIAGV